MVVQDDVSTVLVSDLGFNAKFVDDEDGKLYIASKEELWSTDGTVEGTRVEFETDMQAHAIEQGVIAGNNFFYSNRFDVWQSDFTQTAPVIKVDNTVTEEDYAELIGRSGETLYYRAGFRRTSLWAVDGASAVEVLRLPTGQSIVYDSVSSFYEDQPPRNTTIDGWFYFLVHESESEQSLRRTRGTPETTETIGVLPAGEVTFTSVDDTLTMFIRQRRPDGGWSSEDGTQLWVSDVDDGSVRMVAEQIPHSSSRFLQSMPESFNGKLYFPVSEDDCAGCLWSSDFTVDGTGAVSSAESIQNIFGLRQVAESLFFVSWRGELFRLQADDSLVSVGIKLDNGNPCCTQITSVSDRYVTVTNSEDSVGTLTRTVVSTNGLEADVMEVPRSATLLTVVGDRIHYRIQNEDSQFEYYSSDGTTDGTRLYFRESVQYEFVPLEEGVIQRLQLGGDTVSFFTDDGTYVYLRTSDDLIWKSDGTAEQTHILTDVSDFAIPYGGGGGTFHASSTHLFFTATTKDVSDSLFRVSTSIGPLVGDVDQDWDVDFADFLQLSMNFGRDVDVLFKDGDLNEDGRITFEDFLLLSAGFGTDLSRPVT